jgi:hypothetical protein
MATLDELAAGFASILRSSPSPEPLAVDLWNHGALEASHLVKRVIEICGQEGIAITTVRIDPDLADFLRAANRAVPFSHNGVPVVEDAALQGRLEFYRMPR